MRSLRRPRAAPNWTASSNDRNPELDDLTATTSKRRGSPDDARRNRIERGRHGTHRDRDPRQTGWIPIDWKELYAFRELLFFFVWRDISARYKQTVLGSAWAVIQPLLMMGIFSFVARFAGIHPPKINGAEIPYPVFVYAGLIPWTVFSQGMPQSALSLVANHHMMTKVYFPRLFLPVTAAAVFLVDLAYSLGIYAVILHDLPDHARLDLHLPARADPADAHRDARAWGSCSPR